MVTTDQQHPGNEVLPVALGELLENVFARLEAADLYFGHGTDNAWDEAVLLVLSACDLPVDADDTVLERPVSAEQQMRTANWLERRIEARLPLPYILGRALFAGLEFDCDERALVPRSPLAEVIREDFRPWWSGAAPRRLLDLCCGGGAIGIAAAVQLPELELVLADLSADALALARQNVRRHGIEGRTRLVESDLFAALAGERFDIILCNPPYVDAHDLATMPKEYTAEPALGLGSGIDGLDHARRIIATAAAQLTEQGLLFLELGNSWQALDSLLSALPLTWLEFSDGGHGVLLLQRSEIPGIDRALATGQGL
ncbi:MAG: 50S ribosomal protein L3 N(5)-glutamine methyltransferase [Pseudomonadota bacterium]